MKLLDVNVAWIRPPATWDLLLGSQTLNMETRWRLRDIGVELSWEELDRSQALLNHMLSRYQQVFQILLVLDFKFCHIICISQFFKCFFCIIGLKLAFLCVNTLIFLQEIKAF